MMDLKEIIKWFIPCFHILRVKRARMTFRLAIFFFLFLHLNLRSVFSANLDISKYNNYEYPDDVNEVNGFNEVNEVNDFNEENEVNDFNEVNETKFYNFNDTDYDEKDLEDEDHDDYDNFNYNKYNTDVFSLDYTTEKSLPVRSGKGIFGHGLGLLFGRTFGRPFKKLAAALIPLAFQIGSASTWAVIAAVVGVKTLAIALVILKVLLLAGAAKFGSFFGQKGHASSGWEAPHGHPQKEIHLHIHNGQGHHESTSWNRDGVASPGEAGNMNFVLDPYTGSALRGPQNIISTPYGNYIKIDSHGPNKLGSAFV